MNKILLLALVAMFLQQSFAVLSKAMVPLVAPLALPMIGAPSSFVGIYQGLMSGTQMMVGMSCGNVIRRYGGLRVSQVGLFLVLAAMAAGAIGTLWGFALTAVLIAFGTGASTPASSQILARYSPPRWAPMIFGAKQSAVPVGLAAGGLVVTFLADMFGWQGAMIAVGVMCALFALMLQPARAELDKDRNPSQPLSVSDIKSTMLGVLRTPSLRVLAITMFAFVGTQNSYVAFLVVSLTDRLGMSFAEASGGIFATAMAVAIPTRILWGYVASTSVGSVYVLAGLAFVMSTAAIVTGFYDTTWAFWQILAVAIAFTTTGLGWQGVMLAEIARNAPEGQVGSATGGVLAFANAGQTVMPVIFSAILAATGDYTYGFVACALPTFLVGFMLLYRAARAERPAS